MLNNTNMLVLYVNDATTDEDLRLWADSKGVHSLNADVNDHAKEVVATNNITEFPILFLSDTTPGEPSFVEIAVGKDAIMSQQI